MNTFLLSKEKHIIIFEILHWEILSLLKVFFFAQKCILIIFVDNMCKIYVIGVLTGIVLVQTIIFALIFFHAHLTRFPTGKWYASCLLIFLPVFEHYFNS
jgi:hypothetical protein